MSKRPIDILPPVQNTKSAIKQLGQVTHHPQFNGLWWPSAHKPSPKLFNHMNNAALAFARHVKKAEVCVIAGAGLGPLPLALSPCFQRVYAFEPDLGLFGALRRNLHTRVRNVAFYKDALGPVTGITRMTPSHELGEWRIEPTGPVSVMMTTIDALEMDRIDLLVISCRYYRDQILDGAAQALKNQTKWMVYE